MAVSLGTILKFIFLCRFPIYVGYISLTVRYDSVHVWCGISYYSNIPPTNSSRRHVSLKKACIPQEGMYHSRRHVSLEKACISQGGMNPSRRHVSLYSACSPESKKCRNGRIWNEILFTTWWGYTE